MDPKAFGRKRSRPATNGSLAVAANQPPTPPTAFNVTSAAANGASQPTPTFAVMAWIACMMPWSPEICCFGIASRTANVPARYNSVMTTAAASTARGIVRRGSRISSPIVDALSTPPKANAIVDQKMTSLRLMPGTSDAVFIGVADPNRIHEIAPSVISSPADIHAEMAPTLLSHLPMSTPTTLIVTAKARPMIDTVMKYAPLADNACHDGPPTNSRFPAAKYSSDGKYGRFVPQYDHPVRKAANGPKARLLQT